MPYWSYLCFDILHNPGIILGMGSANETQSYIVTLSLVGWTHTQNDPIIWDHLKPLKPSDIHKEVSHYSYLQLHIENDENAAAGPEGKTPEDEDKQTNSNQSTHAGNLADKLFVTPAARRDTYCIPAQEKVSVLYWMITYQC